MVRALVSRKSARQVPLTRAASGAGRNRRIRRGQRTQIARATAPTTRSCQPGSARASGYAAIWASGPPETGSAPRKGMTCRTMMITPIPVMKPEITESRACSSRSFRSGEGPGRSGAVRRSMTMVKAVARLSAYKVTIAAMATVIGPVGPEICEGVPPNTARRIQPRLRRRFLLRAQALRQRRRPMPSANITIADVTPPKTSPGTLARTS